MKVHPRTDIVQKAENEAHSFLLELSRKHKLTTCEFLMILTGLMQLSLKFALRSERHPDKPDSPADCE